MRHSALAPHTKKTIKINELMPKYGVKKRRQTDKELAEKARLWCEAANKLAASGKLKW